jgi:uncharacterized alpha/beta hydrolase family protein
MTPNQVEKTGATVCKRCRKVFEPIIDNLMVANTALRKENIEMQKALEELKKEYSELFKDYDLLLHSESGI